MITHTIVIQVTNAKLLHYGLLTLISHVRLHMIYVQAPKLQLITYLGNIAELALYTIEIYHGHARHKKSTKQQYSVQ